MKSVKVISKAYVQQQRKTTRTLTADQSLSAYRWRRRSEMLIDPSRMRNFRSKQEMISQNRKEQVKTINVQARFSCNCNLEFEGSSKAENHDPEKLQCSVCKNWHVSQRGLREHQLRVHQGLKRFICDLCSRSFCERSEIRDHIQALHLKYNLKFNCTFAGCTKFFKTKRQLRRHKSLVHSKNILWNICNRTN